MQRLACSVNAAFRTRFATALDWNAAFRLLPGSKHRTIGAMPRLQRERCVPDQIRNRARLERGLQAAARGVDAGALVQRLACSVNAAFLKRAWPPSLRLHQVTGTSAKQIAPTELRGYF